MTRQILLFLIISTVSVGVLSCEKKSAYQQLVESNYQKGAQNDSLLLGYHFGMTKDQFYDHSWDLNRKKLVRQGEGNKSIRYEFTGLGNRAKMNFFPVFHQDSIYSLPVQYAYNGWAPWNRKLWADSLEQDLLTYFQDKHGYNFKRMQHPEKEKSAYITIEGNKRIAIFQLDNNNQKVAVVYTDLDVLNRITEEKENDKN